ncbi:E3 binding domain-containing protein [Oceanithermus sp.]|uniref:E3 binding domain-containing protein n=1 Tax=Oceanithermus sp. TaxID=2268145 RepID=UPI0025F41619|nr:E3 binding domain-containing protein [Oceanithermus sp.]
MTEPKITPLARRLAEENGIDWQALQGTGPDGTIVERDILAFLAKVMAGEVELPPQPGDAPPPDEVPDLSQVQEALAKEGVDLGELVPPEITSETPPPPEPEPVFEEETLFEMDFEEVAEAEVAAEDAFPQAAPPEPAPAPAEEAGWLGETEEAVEPAEAEESLEFSWEEAAAETAAEAPETAQPWAQEDVAPSAETEAGFEVEADAWEAELGEAVSAAEDEGLPGAVAGEAAMEEAWAAAEAESPVTEPEPGEAELGGWETLEEVETPIPEAAEPAEVVEAEETATIEPEPEPQETDVAAGFEAEPAAVAEGERETEPEAEPAAAAAAVPGVVFPPAFRRAVALAAAERAREDLSAAWRKDVPLELLLFRAVDRALAELEVPMRAVLGRFEGEHLRSLAVLPAANLRDLYHHIQEAREEGEGLVVLDLGATPYAEVILPDHVLVTLGRAGLPEGLGLLSISGELPTDRTRFLERVAFYLERPILLA